MPIMVVLGNPPYSGHSANKGQWIRSLVEDYKRGRPELQKPAKAKWLQDDYVKFIRFAEWRVSQTGNGIVALITNHSYLDSPTFPGMRQHLLETFDDVYLLDLHGNVRKKEQAPDGTQDENVFDIQQGVAILLLVKKPAGDTGSTAGPPSVRHADLWGPRPGKYDWLLQHDIGTTVWTDLTPLAPEFLFVPQDAELPSEYNAGVPVDEIFSPNGDPAPGIVTTHDDFAISWDAAEADTKVHRLLGTRSEEEARSLFRLCSQEQWNYERAKGELLSGAWRRNIRPVLYRPFDIRYTVYDRNVAVHRRERVMRHLVAGPNLALITSKLTKGEPFRQVQATRLPTEVICMSPRPPTTASSSHSTSTRP